MKNKNFVMVYHIMFAKNTKFGVSDKGIYAFAGLQFLKTSYDMGKKENVVSTTLLQLVDICKWSTDYRKEKGEKMMINALQELIDTGYIEIKNEKKNWKKEVLYISLVKIELDESENLVYVNFKDNPINFAGFEKVIDKEFNCQNYKDFSIYLYVKWRSNANFVYRISYDEWAYVLGVAEKTARNRIEVCHSILKQPGRYQNEKDKKPKRMPNTYYVKPSVVYSAKKNLMSRITDESVLMNPKLLTHMIDLSCFMTHEAYKKYKETEDDVLKSLAQDKINVISSTQQGKRGIERLENVYQSDLKKEKRLIIEMFESFYSALVNDIDDMNELINKIFYETVSTFYLKENTLMYKELKKYADELRDELKQTEDEEYQYEEMLV